MANIERVVNVQISLNTAGITSEGFSTLMVVGPHAYTTTRVLSITDVDKLTEYGFSSTDPIYLAASDALSQTPRPSVVKIGRLQCDTIKVGLIAEPVVDAKYSITVSSVSDNGEAINFTFETTAQSGDTASDIMNELAKKVIQEEATKTVYTATVLENYLVLKATDPKHSFTVEPNGLLEIKGFELANIDLAENMAMITAADNDFYGVIYTSRDTEDVIAMADWTESHTKLFGTATNDAGAKNPEVATDIGSKLKDGNYYRTYWFYHDEANRDFPEAAVMARCFAILPGGETWALKRLSAVTTDHLKEGEYNAITQKNGNTFEAFRNVTITQNGKVAAGEWIDVIRFRDWLVETIQTEVFSTLINRDKLPFTDAGIAVVENAINATLELGQTRGGIAPTEYDEAGNKNYGFTISVPRASSISANVKAQRVLEDVKFTARLAGAVHVIKITGSLTYENLIETSSV